jgi:hypothetical protein
MRSFGIIFLIGFLVSCKKIDHTVPNSIDAGLKTHFDYKPGTYWVYRDSITGGIDSFVTVSRDSGVSGYLPLYGKNPASFVNILINGYPTSSALHDKWTWSLQNNGIFVTMPDFAAPLFYYPFSIGKGDWAGDAYNVTEIQKRLVINTDTFMNVAVINHSKFGEVYDDWFYINDQVGIIKMKFTNYNDSTTNRIWELQRYKIIR